MEEDEGEDASTVEGHLRRPEAAIFLYFVDSYGDMVVEGQDAASGRDLQIHRRSVPLLQEGHSKVAELVEAQFVLQRLLHQGRCDRIIIIIIITNGKWLTSILNGSFDYSSEKKMIIFNV